MALSEISPWHGEAENGFPEKRTENASGQHQGTSQKRQRKSFVNGWELRRRQRTNSLYSGADK